MTVKLQQTRFFVALNLYNNAPLVPFMKSTLETWLKMLPKKTVVFISVFENGSTDETPRLLEKWHSDWLSQGISHSIISDRNMSRSDYENQNRIKYLSNVRNIALKPLVEWKNTTFDRIIFLNDIYISANDLMKLVFTEEMEYDTVCAMDFTYQFYDVLVTRDRRGRRLQFGLPPFYGDAVSRSLFRQEHAVPVQSCWNGVVVMQAAPFQSKQLQFRYSSFQEENIQLSECCLVHLDMARLGYSRILMSSQVFVAYDWWTYHFYIPVVLGFLRRVDRFFLLGGDTLKEVVTTKYDFLGADKLCV